MAKRQHNHHIDVETDDPFLTVTIGSDGGVPGGFAKLFNRIVDSESWARLGDAARAVYIPLVRFADHRNQFRVQMGQAALMKYSGLSRSSIKRAIRDLVTHRLIVVVERGGVSEMGLNESNVYQLLVPAASRRKPAEDSLENPQGVQPQTPSSLSNEPSPGSPLSRPGGHERTETGRSWTGDGGAATDPQYRNNSKEISNRAGRLQIPPPSPQCDAAALLEKCGVESAVARRLAEAYPHARIVDVIATMEWRRARGKCDNPAGFVHDALVRQWQTPKSVFDARARAEARLRSEAAELKTRAQTAREAAVASDDDSRVEKLLASLDEDEIQILSESVLRKYEGNAAVSAVLTRKPARECRLMRMEIAALLQGGAQR